jgi:hypothetical protein
MYTTAISGTIAVVEPGVCYPVLGWSAHSFPIVANPMGGTHALDATEYLWVGEIALTPELLRPQCTDWTEFESWFRLDWEPELRIEDLPRWRGKAGQ